MHVLSDTFELQSSTAMLPLCLSWGGFTVRYLCFELAFAYFTLRDCHPFLTAWLLSLSAIW